MKFVDDLYEYYKDRLDANDDDVELLVGSIMQEFSREDMLKILSEAPFNDLYKITGTYIAFKLREKLLKEQGMGFNGEDKTNFLH